MANTKVANLTAASALTGTELFYADDGVNDVKVTALQIKNYAVNIPFLIGANVAISTTDLKIGNTTANIFANSVLIRVANSSGAINVQSTSLQVGANVTLSTTMLSIGTTANSTANSTMVRVANSTGSANLQPTALTIGSASINTTAYKSGANVYLSTTTLSMGNSTVNLVANSTYLKVANSSGVANLKPTSLYMGANVYVSTTTMFVGNSTVNAAINSTMTKMTSTTGSANLTPVSLIVGNSTVYTTIGSATRSVTGSNTFNLGTASATANGYTWLFNGVLLQWGRIAANSSVGNITFPVAFPTAIFSYQATSMSAAAGAAVVIAANTTTMNVRTELAVAGTNTFWLAIGN